MNPCNHATRRIIITADIGCGKTGFIKRTASYLAENGIPHAGFFAEGSWEGDRRGDFTLTLLPGMSTIPLCDRTTEGWPLHGRFRFNPDALEQGRDAIGNARPGEIIIMDEIGNQELRGWVWAGALTEAINKVNPLILSVRHRNLPDIMKKWELGGAHLYNGNTTPWDSIWSSVLPFILDWTHPFE